MCDGIAFLHQGKKTKTLFPNPRAQLPVMMRDGQVYLFSWGRRKNQAGNLPLGGWARIEAIQEGRWDAFFPKPVKIAATDFMVKDIEETACWFPLNDGQWVQGLLARYDQERRIYLVTVTPKKEDALFIRWPRIINAMTQGV